MSEDINGTGRQKRIHIKVEKGSDARTGLDAIVQNCTSGNRMPMSAFSNMLIILSENKRKKYQQNQFHKKHANSLK